MQSFFSNNPFLRLIIPFLGGTIFAVVYNVSVDTWNLLLVLFLILGILTILPAKSTSKTRFLFLITADVFLFCFALQNVKSARIDNQETFYGNHLLSDSVEYTFLAAIDNVPEETEKFYKCHLTMRAVCSDSSFDQVNGNIIGYFRKEGGYVKAGDELLVRTKLLKPQEPKNPFEFDYKEYLSYRQIHYTFFADSSCFKQLPVSPSLPTPWLYGLKIKEKILNGLKSGGLSNDAYSICAALLTGYDADIDEGVSEAFSHSGTLHVLSVSGLHTGLIYLCIIFLFDLFDKNKKLKYTRFFTVITVLWFFALITGFNAPVLRAVIMFSLLGAGKIFFRSNSRNQINILIATAFMMLCYNPFYIMDVGFQLSFVAVAGMFLFQPVLMSFYKPEGKFSLWLFQGISTSVAATIATLPLTLFYFKQFPIWFFVTNLVVVPVAFVLLILTVLVLIKASFVIPLINLIVLFLIEFMKLFNSPRFGYIDNIHFSLNDALILGVFLIMGLYAYTFRSRRYVFASLIILIFWQVNSLAVSFESKSTNLFSLYHIRKEPAVCVKNQTVAFINSIGRKNFNYHVKPHLITFNYPDTLRRNLNFISRYGSRYLILNKKNTWPRTDYSKITHLVVENDFRLTEADLHSFKSLQTIIVDGSNNRFTKRKLAELCSKFDIALYDTQNKGAYIAAL